MTKQVLCINDLSCVGRCSLSVILPVLSAMDVCASGLPTALLSTHTGGFTQPHTLDTQAFAQSVLRHFASENIQFDAVLSGYFINAEAIGLALEAYGQSPAALRVVDPVLGDAGKLYHGQSAALCDAMRALCKGADIITPNVTESAVLLGLAPSDAPFIDEQAAYARCAALLALGAKAVVLKGVRIVKAQGALIHCNICQAQGGAPLVLPYTAENGAYPGTGDLFVAALTGALVHGQTLAHSVALAAQFVALAVQKANVAGREARFGVPFEACLDILR